MKLSSFPSRIYMGKLTILDLYWGDTKKHIMEVEIILRGKK